MVLACQNKRSRYTRSLGDRLMMSMIIRVTPSMVYVHRLVSYVRDGVDLQHTPVIRCIEDIELDIDSALR